MLGGLSRTATSSLRQLIDAGTLSNLPAGFKARGLRVSDDDQPIQPGEFRDVDAPSGDLRTGLLPLPYKEPSQTLFLLLGFCVDAGKRFAAVADAKIADANQANPVGTTMAMIEQGTKVMSAIHKRLHYAQRIEFKLLAKIFQQYLPPEYPYNVVGGNRMIKQTDFDDRVDIIPVSDPNIFSMSQRIQLAQAQLQLTVANPQIHNVPELCRYREAHIKTHRAFMSSALVRQSAIAMAALQSHISEHIALMSRQIVMEKNKEELQQLQAQTGGQVPPELQQELTARLESEIAETQSKITEEIVAEEQEYLEGSGKDPLVELKNRELDIKEADNQRKTLFDAAKLSLDKEKLDQKSKNDEEKLDQDAKIAAMRAGVNLKQTKLRK